MNHCNRALATVKILTMITSPLLKKSQAERFESAFCCYIPHIVLKIEKCPKVYVNFRAGRPLYYYSGDKNPGETNGQGFNNLWYVSNTSGSVPVVTTIPTTIPTSVPTAVPTTIPTRFDYGGGGY